MDWARGVLVTENTIVQVCSYREVYLSFADVEMIDWDSEVRGFYSRPEDLHTVYTADNRPSLPFTVQACNRNSLIAVGDESGAIRLIESAKDENPGFGM